MGNVVTLPDQTPPARYDSSPWTEAIIAEAAASQGPYNTIATVTLSPVDPDPTHPQARNFTTSAAVLTAGWYLLTWQDAAGGQFAQAAQPYPPPADQAFQPYCSVLDVLARNAARTVTASSVPNIAQVQQMVIDAAAEINAILVNKGYLIPIISGSNPDAFAVLHSLNATGGWAMMELAAPNSTTKDAAAKAWEAAKTMLSDQAFVLNAPQDVLRTEPRAPWITAQPSGRHFDPTFHWGRDTDRRNPYLTRNMQF